MTGVDDDETVSFMINLSAEGVSFMRGLLLIIIVIRVSVVEGGSVDVVPSESVTGVSVIMGLIEVDDIGTDSPC